MSSDTTEESSTKASGTSSQAPSAPSSLETSVTSTVSLGDNDASPPLLPGSSEESQHQADPKAPDKSNGIQDETEVNETKPIKGEIQDRIRTLCRSFEYGEAISKVFSDYDKAEFLLKSMKSVQWIYEAVTALETEPEPNKEPTERVIAIPEAKTSTWKEWTSSSRNSNESHSALYILTEERPSSSGPITTPPMRISEFHSTNPKPPSSSHVVAKQLPSRIRIFSVAAKRILDTMCDDRLPFSETSPLVLLRPYKLLTYHNQNIRKRLTELEQACIDHPQQRANENEDDEKEAEVETGSHSDIDGVDIFTTNTNWNALTLKEKEEAARDLRVVVSFMDEYLAPLAPSGLLFTTDSLVRFNELWHFFKPGSIVYTRDRTVPQKVWKVMQGSGGRRSMATVDSDELALGSRWLREKCNPFKLDCYYIDYDGSHFARVIRTFIIEEYSDAQPAKLLQILPISIAEQEGLVKESDLMERGKTFLECATVPYKYMYYRGRSLSHAPNGDVLTRPDPGSLGSIAVLSDFIESPVVVDFERCLQLIPDWSPTKSTVELYKGPENEVEGDGADRSIEDDRVWDVRMVEDTIEITDPTQRLDKYDRQPSDRELLLLPDRVFAYVLRTRRWACLQLGVDNSDPPQEKLKEMQAKKEAWADLQINPMHKTVIESLMRSHFEKSKSQRRQFDLIQDKGKGLIILLHGVPGVGKTSTAETVAECYNKPLLPITCGDLGLTPPEVEENLQRSFELAQAWQCVLLLDEADVFLAERSRDNIERNALVSVFLRVLEYYEGVLFLTTNKVGSFDEAFKSRISMALYYPPLSMQQTLAIWNTQIDRTRNDSKASAPDDPMQHIDFDSDRIRQFALTLWNHQESLPQFRPVWNGRQIRNAFQTAVALAEVQRKEGTGIMVTESHFVQVSQVSNEFNKYLWQTKLQRSDDVLNLKRGYRDDTFQHAGPSSSANDDYARNVAVASMQSFVPQAVGAPGPRNAAPNAPLWGGHQQDGSGQPAQAVNASFLPGNPVFGHQQPQQQQSSFQASSGYQQQTIPASGYPQYGQQIQQQPANYGNAGGQSFAGGGSVGPVALQQGQNQGLPPQQQFYNNLGYSGQSGP